MKFSYKNILAEFLGTFLMVFCGTGAIIINQASNGAITHAGIAFTFGAVVFTLIYTFGEVSGAHFNPAVSIAFAFCKRFSWTRVPAYVLSQCLGALAASLLLYLLFPETKTFGETVPAGSILQSFVLELLLTFFLMLTILQVSSGATEKGIVAGLVIGAVVGLEAMFAGPICGASMNPARSLGPALVSTHTHDLWIYLLAPVLGAALAVPIHQLLKEKRVGSKA
jgi:aquaporin NIP